MIVQYCAYFSEFSSNLEKAKWEMLSVSVLEVLSDLKNQADECIKISMQTMMSLKLLI